MARWARGILASTVSARILLLVTLLATLAPLPACSREAPRADPRPSVLLISLDSVRRDLVGAYGARLPHADGRSPSPNIDRLATEGVLVEDALSTTSWTLPAHVTLLTGLPELVHGVEQDGQRLDDSIPTLAEILRDAGYRTAGVYSGPYLDPRFGFGRGFERYRAGYGPELTAAAQAAAAVLERVHAFDEAIPRDWRLSILDRNADAEDALELASHRDSSSRTVTDLVLEELEEAADDERPFFLFAHYFDPHYDYVPPPHFEREFDPDYDGPIDGRDIKSLLGTETWCLVEKRWMNAGDAGLSEPRDVEHLRALQAGELAWTDAELGRILDELERLHLAEGTLVVLVSDHGDEFLEHGSFGHRQTLFEEVVRVPMILRLPRRLPRGARIEGTASLAEVAPTVLELLGIAAPPAALPRSNSLVPRLSASMSTSAIGRLVLNRTALVSAMAGGQSREFPCTQVHVIESYRQGTLKLVRERTWQRPIPSEAPSEVNAQIERRGQESFAHEALCWIDLARHPEERGEDWSSDFTDAAVRAALEAFRREYEALARARRTPALTEKTDDLLAAFRGLGYAGEEARLRALPSDELLLPPPGEALLGIEGGR